MKTPIAGNPALNPYSQLRSQATLIFSRLRQGEVQMLDDRTTRRATLFALAAGAAAAVSACNSTQTVAVQTAAAQPAAPGIRIGGVQVDTTPLQAQSGNPTAAWAQQALPGYLAQVLASRMAPGDPKAATLGVRIDSIYLGGGGPADPDRMRGAATLNGRGVRLLATSTYFANPTDQALPEQALQGRVQALSQAFAYRLRRKMHL